MYFGAVDHLEIFQNLFLPFLVWSETTG